MEQPKIIHTQKMTFEDLFPCWSTELCVQMQKFNPRPPLEGRLSEPPKVFLQWLFNEIRYRNDILANC